MSQAVIASPNLTPADLPTAFRLADMMAGASLVPKHLQGKPADCLLVIEQAVRWSMSPFAVAQATSVIGGKLMYEGKLVAAAINSSGLLSDRLAYDFTGAGDARTVTVSGTIRGETKAREATVTLRDARTENAMWKRQPDQQLVYSGARVWARRHAPEVMLGVYTPDEFDEPPPAPPAAWVDLKVNSPASPAAGPSEELEWRWWLNEITNAENIDELGQVSQEIAKAGLAADVLAKLRSAFIARKVQLTPTSQPQPVAPPDDEIDPETGEMLPSMAQASPLAGAEPAPATDAPASAEPAQQAPQEAQGPSVKDTPEQARQRGALTFKAGGLRKALPGAYRGNELGLEWQDGYDRAKAAAEA